MTLDNMTDKLHEPSLDEIAAYMNKNASQLWQAMISFAEQGLGAKRQVTYSCCAGKPGWNVKYKKRGKALCTLYPEQDRFIALVVLGQNERMAFDITKEEYCDYIQQLYDKCTLFNGTKWLMIAVDNEGILEEVQRLIRKKLS